ncbi:MAG: hypothetical protein LBI28_04165 [Treponema sp.]|jgi:magnesium-transporting ATPase (P-type)|nr:hypothetical protein [Treponema sp.]
MTKIENGNKEMIRRDQIRTRMQFAATAGTEELFEKLVTGLNGIHEAFVVDYRDEYGNNKLSFGKRVSLSKKFDKTVFNPYAPINVQRQGAGEIKIPLGEVVVGDIVHLSAGDMIPADMRILKAKDLFVNQSALTGENTAVEKFPATDQKKHDRLTKISNLAFLGSTVFSGSAIGVVVAVGDDTIFGEMA